MDKITIYTDLDGFVLVDEIIDFGTETIKGTKHFSDAPIYLGIESLAQLGALHIRFLTGFERHAFLLKINHFTMPEKPVLNHRYFLEGRRIHRSGRAFSYLLQARKGSSIRFYGEFLFATVGYDRSFNKEILQNHYKKVFLCLQSGSKTD
jgi:hypothetical protein